MFRKPALTILIGRIRLRRARPVALAMVTALSAGVFGDCAAGRDRVSQEISVSCRPGDEMAQTICDEFISYLRETRPDLAFRPGDPAAPGIELLVTHATERGLGLDIIWIAANGQKSAGLPLKTAFFDRSSDKILRRTFYTAFLRQNPLPF